jgi:hypothetical protein
MALRAMAEDPDLSVPDYAALKAVFELSYFEVRTPHIFVKLADMSGDDTGAANEDDMHMMPQRELKDSQQCVRLLVLKKT